MIIEEPFAIGNSCIHQIDPKIRILCATLISVEIALLKQLPVLALALLIAICLMFIARLNLKCVIQRLYVIFWFLLLVWLTLPITFGGDMIYKLGPINISRFGIILSAQMTLKSMSILLIFMAMISTMTINTLGRSLSALRCPSKLVYLLLMTYRYIFVIDNEYRRLHKAIKMRGFRSKANIHSYKTYAYLIGMLFVRASVRAKRVHHAMLCRGFNGRFYSLEDPPNNFSDVPFSVIMTTLIIGLICLEVYSYGHI